MTQFIKIPLWLMARRDVSDGAKLLWSYLRDREALYGTGQCFEGRERIAEAIGTNVDGYKRRSAELQAAGLLVVEPKAGPYGTNTFCTAEADTTVEGRGENAPTRGENAPKVGAETHRGSGRKRTVGRGENAPQVRLKNQPEEQTDSQTLPPAPEGEATGEPVKVSAPSSDSLRLALEATAPEKPKKAREKKTETPKPAAPAANLVIAAIAKGYREAAGRSLPKETVNGGQARKLGEAAVARNPENPFIELEALGRAVGSMRDLAAPLRYLAKHGFDALPIDVPAEVFGPAETDEQELDAAYVVDRFRRFVQQETGAVPLSATASTDRGRRLAQGVIGWAREHAPEDPRGIVRASALRFAQLLAAGRGEVNGRPVDDAFALWASSPGRWIEASPALGPAPRPARGMIPAASAEEHAKDADSMPSLEEQLERFTAATPDAVREGYLERWRGNPPTRDEEPPLVAREPGHRVWVELAREVKQLDRLRRLLDAAFVDAAIEASGWDPQKIRWDAVRLLTHGASRPVKRGVAAPATHAQHAADAEKYGETFNGF